jgi:hypothetical protein
MPLLQADPRVSKVIGIARRPFDPSAEGWTKMEYRQGDVRDPEALQAPARGATSSCTSPSHRRRHAGDDPRHQRRGHLNTFRAAADAGAERFVYASSIAAYGFHKDNPVGMTEDWPVRPADKLFYAQEKAELEDLLQQEATQRPSSALYLLRPPVVLGRTPSAARRSSPAARAAEQAPAGHVPAAARAAARGRARTSRCSSSRGRRGPRAAAVRGRRRPAGAYNIAGDGVLSAWTSRASSASSPCRCPPGRCTPRPCRVEGPAAAQLAAVGRGLQPPGRHGHHPGQDGARLGAAVHRPRGAAGHPRLVTEQRPRVGLVLGAGGVLGGAWLAGALAALTESTGWDPATADVVVGTSAGSMIGALLAGGVPPWFMVAHSAGESFPGLLDATGQPTDEADRSAGGTLVRKRGVPDLRPHALAVRDARAAQPAPAPRRRRWRRLRAPGRHVRRGRCARR